MWLAPADFYQRILGFELIADFGGRGCALQASEHQVLLLFKKGASRGIPSPHDGDGELHLAFAIAAIELAPWEEWLAENHIAVEEGAHGSEAAKACIFATPTGIS